MTIDRSFLERLEAVKAAQERAQDDFNGGVAGGGPPDPPGMDVLIARVDGLEKAVGKLEVRLDGLDARVRGVEVTLAGVSAKLDTLTTSIVGKLPSWWQLPLVIVGTVTALTALQVALAHYLPTR